MLQYARRLFGLFAAVATALSIAVGSAHALPFTLWDGAVEGSFDTDLTYSASLRTEDATAANKGAYGNRHLFDEAGHVFSHLIRGSHALQLSHDRYGAFVRGNWFFDFEMANQNLTNGADRAARDGFLTDGYVYAYLGPKNDLAVRAGQQVINWGENTFIGGALADINTVDVTRLRQPGAELKDAVIGTPAVDVTLSFLDNWTVEGFALLGFDEIRIDPMGSFFTTSDAVTDGGGFPNTVDEAGKPRCLAPDDGACDLLGGRLTRSDDDFPSSSGQWGVALRRFVPALFNGTEFGIYYQNLHDHLFMISGFSQSGKFFLDYPEDIQRTGASFNTNIAGLAISGEYSYRHNAPVQLTAPLLWSAGIPTFVDGKPFLPPAGTEVKGFARLHRHQAQVTVNKNWGVLHVFRADAATTILEVAVGWITGEPKIEKLAQPTPLPLTTVFEPDLSNDFSKLVIRHSMTYQAALFNLVALEPNVAFSWDIHGFSNEPGGAKLFLEDRKAVSIGLGFAYGSGSIGGGVSYTNFLGSTDKVNNGGGRLNGTTDRDFVSVSVSYSL